MVNFGTLEWVRIEQPDMVSDPIYTFHFVSGDTRNVPADITLRVEIEKHLAEWQGKPFDAIQTVEIPAFHKTRFLRD